MAYGEPRAASPGPLAEAQEEVSKLRAMAVERSAKLREEANSLEKQAQNLIQASMEWAALANTGADKAHNSEPERSY